jgi:hypothetical protein
VLQKAKDLKAPFLVEGAFFSEHLSKGAAK